MKLNTLYLRVACLCITSIFLNINTVPAQQRQDVNSKTGKPGKVNKLQPFKLNLAGSGFIEKTNIRFSFTDFETNNEQIVTRQIFFSEDQSEIKGYLLEAIRESSKIIERNKIAESNSRQVIERVVLEFEDKDGKYYRIFRYDTGKNLISFSARILEVAQKFEHWLYPNDKMMIKS
jgi:hypothetical protein